MNVYTFWFFFNPSPAVVCAAFQSLPSIPVPVRRRADLRADLFADAALSLHVAGQYR